MQLAEPVLFSKPKIIQVRMPVDTIIQNLQLGYTILSDSLYDNCIAVHKEDLEHGHYQTGIYDIELTLKAQPKSSLTQKLFKSDESLVACNLDCNPFFGGSEFYLKFHSAFRLSDSHTSIFDSFDISFILNFLIVFNK